MSGLYVSKKKRNIADGTVATFADLPSATDNLGKIYVVRETTGIIFVNQKKAGFYFSNGTNWVYLESFVASEIPFDNSGSSIASSTVENAIKEVDDKIEDHEVALDPHPQYTTSAEVSADIDSAISVHEAASNPHPNYVTQTELEEFNVFQLYQVNEVDDNGAGVTYVGKAKTDGKWFIERITESGDDLSKDYANLSNNSGVTTFSTAWTNRASLTYGNIETITGL